MIPIPPEPILAHQNIQDHDAIVHDAFSASPIANAVDPERFNPVVAGHLSVAVPT
jgi:hypothetical protein